MQRRGWLSGLALVLAAACLVGWSDADRRSGPFEMNDLTVGPRQVSFVERGTAHSLFDLENTARGPVAVVGVRAVDPPTVLLRWVGTWLAPWPACKDARGGYCAVFPETRGARPVTIAPGGRISVRLNYRFVDCLGALQIPWTKAAPWMRAAQSVVVTYRDGRQALKEQTLRLDRAQLLPGGPTASNCPASG
jgi:hypothetical protein